MSAPRERSLEHVKHIVLDALRGRPARVYLFGSSATGSARRLTLVRRDIAAGRIARRTAHGQPYWTEVA